MYNVLYRMVLFYSLNNSFEYPVQCSLKKALNNENFEISSLINRHFRIAVSWTLNSGFIFKVIFPRWWFRNVFQITEQLSSFHREYSRVNKEPQTFLSFKFNKLTIALLQAKNTFSKGVLLICKNFIWACLLKLYVFHL